MPAEGVVAVKTYRVTAKRWEHGWELHIDGVGVTQSHGLHDAETMIRDLIARRLDVAEDSFAVEVTPEVGDGLDAETRSAREEIRALAETQRRVAEHSRAVARRLKAKGLSGRDVAKVLGVSAARVSQLLRDEKRAG